MGEKQQHEAVAANAHFVFLLPHAVQISFPINVNYVIFSHNCLKQKQRIQWQNGAEKSVKYSCFAFDIVNETYCVGWVSKHLTFLPAIRSHFFLFKKNNRAKGENEWQYGTQIITFYYMFYYIFCGSERGKGLRARAIQLIDMKQ